MRKLILLIVLSLTTSLCGVYSQETERNYEKEAISRIKRIHQLLEQQNEYPFDELLQTEMTKLTDIESMVEDYDVLKQIEQTYNDYDTRKNELIEQAAAQAQAKEEAAKAEAQAQAKRDSTNAAQAAKQLKEDQDARDKENKKQQITLIVIGIVMAVLLFVANQLIQYFRNKKTQRNIMQMQQQTTQATNPAEVADQMKQKGQTTVKKAVTPSKPSINKGNGKRISI